MILWCDGAAGPGANMQRDAALLAAAEAGAGPVLRLYRFEPAGITLGRGQAPGTTLDLARCARDGVGWAVRPTGGRAIFHDQEWTLGLAAPLDDPQWGGSLERAYDALAGLVLRALLRLGVPAALTRRHPGRGAGPGAAGAGCFAATARHELVVGDRKLVGIAQRRTRTALLQQGSLLLGPSHLRLCDYLAAGEDARERERDALSRAATHAGSWLGAGAPIERWAAALMAELPAGARRLDAGAGAILLTPGKRDSYTASAS